jgi:hypothetical protein
MSLDGVFLSLSRLLEDDQTVRESIKEKVKEIDTVGKKASVDAQGSFSAVTGVIYKIGLGLGFFLVYYSSAKSDSISS